MEVFVCVQEFIVYIEVVYMNILLPVESIGWYKNVSMIIVLNSRVKMIITVLYKHNIINFIQQKVSYDDFKSMSWVHSKSNTSTEVVKRSTKI